MKLPTDALLTEVVGSMTRVDAEQPIDVEAALKRRHRNLSTCVNKSASNSAQKFYTNRKVLLR